MNPIPFNEWKENVQFSADFLKYLKSDLGLTDEQVKEQIDHYLKVEYQSYSDSFNAPSLYGLVCTGIVCDDTNNTNNTNNTPTT